MELTTKNIIKVLPFDKELKDHLTSSFDSLDPDQRFVIERIIWDLYDALYSLKLDENIRLEMEALNDTTNPLTKEFYARVKKKTDQDMTTEFVDGTISVDLEEARGKIEEILSTSKQPAN